MLAPGFNSWGQVLLHFGTSPFEDSVKAVSGEMQHLRALRSFVRCSAPLASSKKQCWFRSFVAPASGSGSPSASARAVSHGPRSIPNWYNRPSGCAGVHRRGTSARCVMLLRSLPSLASSMSAAWSSRLHRSPRCWTPDRRAAYFPQPSLRPTHLLSYISLVFLSI